MPKTRALALLGESADLAASDLAPFAQVVEEQTGRPLTELGLKLVSDAEIKRLNPTAELTDVLSFPNDEGSGGDVVIAQAVARSQAERAGWPLRSELLLLLTHASLH